MSETGVVKGFKVFNPDWTCSPNRNTKQYTCPGKFEEDVTPSMCDEGMHFCKKVADCFNYYRFDLENKVAEVVAYGTVAEDGDKCCTNKLEIVREIPWAELLEIVNMGKGCTGLCSSGNRNSGDWNKCSFSNGCFDTESPKIYLFNKPSEWTYQDWLDSETRYWLNQIPGDVLEYIWLSDITDEEKAAHPEAETTGGYLKILDNPECAVIWWRGLSDRQKAIITAIPNFDKEIFKEITGIDVDED
jgi:hypothetical protein